jgi:hypothetical protein
MEVEVLAFSTPSYVRLKTPPGQRQDGFKEAPAIPLSELDAEVLDTLCNDFRAQVFLKAGKQDPMVKV